MFDAPTIIQLVTDIGSFGFIIWLVHRTTTVTIPGQAKENAVRQEQQRTDFIAAQKQTREDFRLALAEQRDTFRGEMEREREVHGHHVERIIQTLRDMKQ